MRSYGQYCPIARTSELLAERWTPIIVRNLLAGCETFNDLLAGAPGISKALLAQRLELLERHGIISKNRSETTPRRFHYQLTPKGRELKTVTDAMGTWGARWLEVEPDHVTPAYVLWATCKLVDLDKLSQRGLVARFELTDRPREPIWMLLRRPYAEICSTYLGWNEDVVVRTDSATLAHWHLRHVSYRDAVATGRLTIDGPQSHIRSFLRALRASPFAGVQPAQ